MIKERVFWIRRALGNTLQLSMANWERNSHPLFSSTFSMNHHRFVVHAITVWVLGPITKFEGLAASSSWSRHFKLFSPWRAPLVAGKQTHYGALVTRPCTHYYQCHKVFDHFPHIVAKKRPPKMGSTIRPFSQCH